MRPRGLIIAACCLGAGCGSLDRFSRLEPKSDAGPPMMTPGVAPTDILFVVDDSCSMGNEQAAMTEALDSFIQVLGGGDYQIGVISTDTMSSGQREGHVSFSFSGVSPYRLLIEDYDASGCITTNTPPGCLRGGEGQRIIDSGAKIETQVEMFSKNIRVGTCGSGGEQAFDAMMLAIFDRGGCNRGFFRDEANLVIVFVSDEDEASLVPIEDYIEALFQLKTDPSKIRIAAIVGVDPSGEPKDCAPGLGAACGSICQSPPPMSSGQSCTFGTPQCPGEEVCSGSQCEHPAQINWANCQHCAFYQAPDCCTSAPSPRYVEFAKRWEAKVAERSDKIEIQDCQATKPGAVCLVTTICQNTFEATFNLLTLALIPRQAP